VMVVMVVVVVVMIFRFASSKIQPVPKKKLYQLWLR